MSRKRKQGQHRPPKQSIQQQVPLVNPNREQQQRAQHEAQIRAKVESLAATIYSENIMEVIDVPKEEFPKACEEIADRSIDAALVFGRTMWGIQAQRQKPQKRASRPPRVLTEDEIEDEGPGGGSGQE